jgi:hypothetical protein
VDIPPSFPHLARDASRPKLSKAAAGEQTIRRRRPQLLWKDVEGWLQQRVGDGIETVVAKLFLDTTCQCKEYNVFLVS